MIFEHFSEIFYDFPTYLLIIWSSDITTCLLSHWCSVLLIFLGFFFVLPYYVSLRSESVLWCPLWFLHRDDVRFVLPPDDCRRARVLFTLFCVCLRILVSNTYRVLFFALFVVVLCMYPMFASFSGLYVFYWPFGLL